MPLRKITPYLLMLLAVGIVFGNTLSGGFVWDDNVYVLGNAVYRQFDLRRIVTTLANGVEYLPVRDLTYALDYRLWGDKPFGFHVSNLSWYALIVVAVYRFTAELTNHLATPAAATGPARRYAPLATALFFALHPLHSEAVSFITCRNALLSTLFFFVAAHSYLRFLADRSAIRYGMALLAFVLALFAKATAIILPLILLLLNLLGNGRRKPVQYLWLLPFFALSGMVYLLFTAIASRSHIIYWEVGRGGFFSRVATALQIIAFYLGKFLVPLGLSAEYDTSFSPNMGSPTAILTLAGLFAVMLLAYSYRRQRSWLMFTLGWYLITLIPVLNFFPTYPAIADRYALLPSFACCYLLAMAGCDLAERLPPVRVAGAALLLLIAWGGLSVARNRVWRSDTTLWEDTIRVSPGAVKAYDNLGRIYFYQGRYREAFGLFSTSRQLYAADTHYDFFTGFLALVRQDYDEAGRRFSSVLRLDPQSVEALFHMGLVQLARGDREQAAELFRRTIRSWEPDLGNFKPQAAAQLRLLGFPAEDGTRRPSFSR